MRPQETGDYHEHCLRYAFLPLDAAKCNTLGLSCLRIQASTSFWFCSTLVLVAVRQLY